MTQSMKKNHRHRSGAVVVLFALLLPVLIVILGFTIDYANMQRIRHEARVISDLAAKAAADTLARTGGDTGEARKAAKDVAKANVIAGKYHHLEDSEIIFGRAITQGDGSWQFNSGSTPFNSVRVEARRNDESHDGRVPLFFGRFYNKPTFNLLQRSTASFRDVEICLVLDRSGSMKWKTEGENTSAEKAALQCVVPNSESRWLALDNAIETFLTELDATPVQERVAMVTFASDGVTDCGGSVSTASTLDEKLTTDSDKIRDAMEDYNESVWFGGTNITAGLAMAHQHMLDKANANRDRFIIVFTDGKHNTSDFPFDEATACAADGIIVHTITFSDGANQADMETTATNGGGSHYHADGSAELESIFRGLAGSFAIITD